MTGPFSALSREGRREEDAHRLVRRGGTHETCPDREDICVVVLAREPDDVERAAIEECGARARDAVGGHRLALALDESLLQLQTRVVACEINPARIRGIRHWRL